MAWRPKYKQICAICRKNHVLISARGQFPICTQCSMREISKPIEDEKYRKMFDIDQKLYEQSSFLRSIKSNYLRFGSLSEKQVETFKRVAAELANPELSKNNAPAEAVAAGPAAAALPAKKAKTKLKKPKK
ncbi:hypothetical protein HYU40_04510 [Candidatus Woesearchaeota archaeon]|nr:hypothetical protein [Candidatus Woesearchaeota archaeon]